MGAKSVGSGRWRWLAADLPGRNERTADVQLGSDDYPGWLFNLDFDLEGAVVRFEITSDTARNRRVVIAGMSFDDPESVLPLNARFVHDLPFGEIVTTARAVLGAFASESVENVPRDVATRLQHFAAVVRERPGRRGRTDVEYARLAHVYADLVKAGDSAPVLTLAEEMHVAESTIRNQLSEARRRKLLTATKPGRAGGRVTAKAERLLEGTDDGTR